MDDKLAVYIGAHPDDIDIGMSGSIYKFDVNRHPIMWVVVTDGGADSLEYDHDSTSYDNGNPWIEPNQDSNIWTTPNGNIINRANYFKDLVQKRCGIKFIEKGFVNQQAHHSSRCGIGRDWKTRVKEYIGAKNIAICQLTYSDPNDSSRLLLYPDGAMSGFIEEYESSISRNLANEIDKVVRNNDYSRDLIYINSHAPDKVCNNEIEHIDHRITGNAVLKAIDILLNEKGIKEIYASWFNIYQIIYPKRGYSKVNIDVSGVREKKAALCRACWETDFIVRKAKWAEGWSTWGNNKWPYHYPEKPLCLEYDIEISYTAATIKLEAKQLILRRWKQMVRNFFNSRL